MTKKGKDHYEDFYERAFSRQDVDEIYAAGGGSSISKFMKVSSKNVDSKGYISAMKKRAKAGKHKGWTLGGIIWDKFFKDGNITQTKTDRVVFAKGFKKEIKGKEYKGGMFVPQSYFLDE